MLDKKPTNPTRKATIYASLKLLDKLARENHKKSIETVWKPIAARIGIQIDE